VSEGTRLAPSILQPQLRMSIYDDEESASGSGIYSGSDELVVPDWDVSTEAADKQSSGGIAAGVSSSGDQVVILCGKKTTMGTIMKIGGGA
jgi:hypothetical protein